MDPPASRRSDRIAARTEPDNMPVNDDPADLQTHEETTSPRQDEQAPAFDVNEAGERERALVDAVRAYLHRRADTVVRGPVPRTGGLRGGYDGEDTVVRERHRSPPCNSQSRYTVGAAAIQGQNASA